MRLASSRRVGSPLSSGYRDYFKRNAIFHWLSSNRSIRYVYRTSASQQFRRFIDHLIQSHGSHHRSLDSYCTICIVNHMILKPLIRGKSIYGSSFVYCYLTFQVNRLSSSVISPFVSGNFQL
jgi:hypothetical protein